MFFFLFPEYRGSQLILRLKVGKIKKNDLIKIIQERKGKQKRTEKIPWLKTFVHRILTLTFVPLNIIILLLLKNDTSDIYEIAY